MGAPWWRIHWRVVIPFAKPGITSGCTIVFMLAAGALAAPQFLGGPSSLWFTQIIYRTFFESVNWPRGAAYAVILLVVCTLFVLLMMRIFQGEAWRDRQMKLLTRAWRSRLSGPVLRLSARSADHHVDHGLQLARAFPGWCRGSA